MTDKKTSEVDDGGWSLVIMPQTSRLAVDFRELWRYRELCAILVQYGLLVCYLQILPTAMYMVGVGESVYESVGIHI